MNLADPSLGQRTGHDLILEDINGATLLPRVDIIRGMTQTLAEEFYQPL